MQPSVAWPPEHGVQGCVFAGIMTLEQGENVTGLPVRPRPMFLVWSPAAVMRIATLAALGLLFLVIYLHAIGGNPAGLFCDEAQVGVEAYRLLRGEADLQPIPLFVRN